MMVAPRGEIRNLAEKCHEERRHDPHSSENAWFARGHIDRRDVDRCGARDGAQHRNRGRRGCSVGGRGNEHAISAGATKEVTRQEESQFARRLHHGL